MPPERHRLTSKKMNTCCVLSPAEWLIYWWDNSRIIPMNIDILYGLEMVFYIFLLGPLTRNTGSYVPVVWGRPFLQLQLRWQSMQEVWTWIHVTCQHLILPCWKFAGSSSKSWGCQTTWSVCPTLVRLEMEQPAKFAKSRVKGLAADSRCRFLWVSFGMELIAAIQLITNLSCLSINKYQASGLLQDDICLDAITSTIVAFPCRYFLRTGPGKTIAPAATQVSRWSMESVSPSPVRWVLAQAARCADLWTKGRPRTGWAERGDWKLCQHVMIMSWLCEHVKLCQGLLL